MDYISLILTIIFGVPGLIIYLRSRKTKLFYVEERQINLQEDLLKNFNNLKITYDDTEINSKISYIKGSIICYGDKDLTDDNNEIEIAVHDYNWLNFKITRESKGLNIDANVTKEKILLNFGLLKSKEFFEFEGLVEKSSSDNTQSFKLNFFHRIANLPEIKQIKGDDIKNASRSILYSLVMAGFSLFFIHDIVNVDKYDLAGFNSQTGKNIEYTKTSLSQSYRKAEDFVKNNYYGIELMFGRKSKEFKIVFDERILDSKLNFQRIKKTERVYFAKDVGMVDYFFLIFMALIFVVSLLLLFANLIAINQKKLTNFLEATANPR
ncbi:hypothetical protein [Flavobacterium caeni]|uniref:Uncharacterized protein n=1 Tax=Flavobacterium caeni TaxID=490189 RepID=A0A1G5KG08_9FLAO|nr:hypothetical protein [Flavobacterium caeni]SCY99575.1 hypothetical protein SAMN02927903_03292 [Flavobacterium caeni]